MKHLVFGFITTTFAIGLASGSEAQQHLGWCIGVGNKHGASDCGAPPATNVGSTGATVATANPLPPATGTQGPVPGDVQAVMELRPLDPVVTTGYGQVPQPQPGGSFTGTSIVLQPLPQQTLTGTSPVPTVQPLPSPSFTGGQPQTITIDPLPQTVLTGTGPVGQLQVQATPSFTGSQPGIVTIKPLPQTVFTGTSAVAPPRANPSPSFTGGPGPLIIRPLPQQTLTGTSPVVPPQARPSPSFTGQGLPTLVIAPNPPRTFEGYGPVPVSVIVVPTPTATPQAQPTQVPQPVPSRVPQATPQTTPGLTQQATPVTTPTAILRPKPRPTLHPQVSVSGGAVVEHVPNPTREMVSETFVTPRAGSQVTHDAPRFETSGGDVWRCMASGHGKRRSYADEEAAASGALVHVGAIDVLGRDLPALHPSHSRCIIAVKRRSE